MIDITKPVWTKRGGVVTEIWECVDGIYPLRGGEIFEGKLVTGIWTLEGKSHRDGVTTPEMDLTNTPPASVLEMLDTVTAASQITPDPVPDETALRAENERLKALLQQARKETAEACRLVVKYQRLAAKGAER